MPTKRAERGPTALQPLDPARVIGGLHGRTARQPVRTTFRLTNEGHEALAWMAERYGLNLKDVVATVVRAVAELRTQPAAFAEWARTAARIPMDEAQRKTQVVPRESMLALRDVAIAAGLPRDRVLEGGIRLVREMTVAGERTLRHQHEKALRLVKGLDERMHDAESRLAAALEPGDPVLYRFGHIAAALRRLAHDIQHELDAGAPVDPEG